jgi:hypothetical protein
MLAPTLAALPATEVLVLLPKLLRLEKGQLKAVFKRLTSPTPLTVRPASLLTDQWQGWLQPAQHDVACSRDALQSPCSRVLVWREGFCTCDAT